MAAGLETDEIKGWAQCLRVGVTGHRLARLADADLVAISDAVSRALGTVAASLPHASSLHLVTSLADGADSIAADAALALEWKIDVVLPLPQGAYVTDFAGGTARVAHEERIARADALFELPIDDGDRTAAYERAGRVMLAQSDIVVAVWDGQPARGRGGAAQIIAEAVLRGIPVIHIDPAIPDSPTLLWDGLEDHDFGQQAVETVARGSLERLPDLIALLVQRQADNLADDLLVDIEQAPRRNRRRFSLAYSMLLAVMGVRRLRRTDLVGSSGDPAAAVIGDSDNPTDQRLQTWFLRADASAVTAGQTFRSAYVSNFALAAIAVIISLASLALPPAAKPLLGLGELLAIGTILVVTRVGRRAQWHRRWLDHRHLAERLRCLLISHRLGELGLRRGRAAEGNWVTWSIHAIGRMVGLPSAQIDDLYLTAVRTDLTDLLDRQIDYLDGDVLRMRTLEHRLHRLGIVLFGTTALICFTIVIVELLGSAVHLPIDERVEHALAIAATIASAALPACGAAIYGIRMQGDFAGIAERGATLSIKLRALRNLVTTDPLRFDLLSRHAERATDLLTEDLSTWLHTYRARPLALPG